jgi:transposase
LAACTDRPCARQGPAPLLTPDQLTAHSQIVETGPDQASDGVVRWRRVDLKPVIEERFGVVYHERTVGRIVHQLGLSHISARPRHPGKKAETIAMFKKLPATLKAHLSRHKQIEIWFRFASFGSR